MHAYLFEEADVQSDEELDARMNADDEMFKHEVPSAVPVILTICRLLEQLAYTVQRVRSHFVIFKTKLRQQPILQPAWQNKRTSSESTENVGL